MMYQVNFLPWRQAKLKRQYRKWGLFLVLQLILWGAFFVFTSIQQQQKIEQYHDQFAQNSQQLEQLKQIISETEQAAHHHHQLTQQLRKKQIFMEQNQRYLQLFRQLPHLLPEKSWLTAFSDDTGQLVFAANSQSYEDVSNLLDNLTGNTSLINVQLKKMTTTSEDYLKVFTIDADWLIGDRNEK
ncbi:PilN domain-containing protein [Xenorhabdus budapestensis]|uniref:PilN domain-containing protein n=1 Tax=Xenorhabdus budapestensis TaxID=290110 RepID=A0ABX7VGM9_XENBU|nr:PilN domain-containing protein [Xenorhabdus budapestensis]QTL39936.1 PilN domain-containing protein [Xenorhabdus budapestensis]